MKAVTYFAIALTLFSSLTFAQESANESEPEKAFISDELFIYMLAGAGTNYRILGSINAGDEISLTGEEANGYTQIIDSKQRAGWIESKFVSENPSLRTVIAQLNSELASYNETEQRLNQDINSQQTTISDLEQQNKSLQGELKSLTTQFDELKLQVDNQDLELKKQYFFYGAMVLGIGLLLGIILPHLTAKKRKTSSWG
ncbi:signal transduction protein [Thalassotalea loyana]|uniref:Signal transduction protein n=1 Tax=Thalassotalea loyana TaxID=280483 RepID=A0ABQ6HCD2_9GAMM|nr:TIGR04211 family SH3 domain-containing protein [Thalassotalea loyana]GLX84422.1 signal transduction protein [Thalassotalea loyana]